MTVADHNKAPPSLRAARQLYGNAAATCPARSDVPYAGSLPATRNILLEQPTNQKIPHRLGQLGGTGATCVERRTRIRAKTNAGLHSGLHVSTVKGDRIASEAASRSRDLQPSDDTVPHAMYESSGGSGGSDERPSENKHCSKTPDAGVPAARALATESSESAASCATACATPKRRRDRWALRDTRGNRSNGLKPIVQIHASPRLERQAHGDLNGVTSLRQREKSEQTRQLTPNHQTGTNRVLKAFAAQIVGKSTRTREFFNLMDSNRDNVVTRVEMENVLADIGMVLHDERLTHLMACFDVQGRGYMTLRDLEDNIRTLRAEHQRSRVAGKTNTQACPQRFPRPRPRPPPNSAAVTPMQSALLAPLTLFSTPARTAGVAKWKRSTAKASEKRKLDQEAGTSYLDITDEEISSLADYLMEAGRGDAGNEHVGRASGSGPVDTDDHQPSTEINPPPLRPLPLVMAALESAAPRAFRSGNKKEGHVRGPGAAAVPSSAARVLLILRSLQKMWRQKDRRRREEVIIHQEADEFSNERLSAAVSLFAADGKGHIDIEDVVAVFRNVRAGKFIRCQPPFAAIPLLAVLERYLGCRGITAEDFVEEAAALLLSGADPLTSPGQLGGEELAVTQAVPRGAKAQRATTAQLAALLCSEVQFSAEQRALVLACVENNGFVAGADLARALRRAKGELARWKSTRSQRAIVGASGECGNSETESQVSELCLTSLSRCQRQAKAVAATKAGSKSVSLPQHKHQCHQRGPPNHDAFNQSDASLVLDLFVKEVGGLRSLTGETAATAWRRLKRRSRGLHSIKAGRLATRHLWQLLRARGLKPLRWFASLDPDPEGSRAGDEGGNDVRRIAISSVICGVNTLIDAATADPPNEPMQISTDVNSEDDSAATSLDETLSNSDGSLEQTIGNGGDEDWAWSRTHLSALARHLDPCGAGRISQADFKEGICDCRVGRVAYPDAAQLAAARRFEAVLRDIGCRDVCGLFRKLAGVGRRGGAIVEYVRQVGRCTRSTSSHELDVEGRQDRMAKTVAQRESEARRINQHVSALLERVSRPENAGALSTIRKIDELMAAQGRCLVVEFNRAGFNHSCGVDHAELKQAMENLVRPCPLLCFERNQRRQRQKEETAAAQKAARWKENFMLKMAAIHQSKASNFLEVVSRELRQRRWKIRDIFQDVDRGKSGALGVDDLLENARRTLGLTLERGDAAALIAMLDSNGDGTVQCEELELALRLYRRYGWERGQGGRQKPFHEQYPSLSCLFHRAPCGEAGVRNNAEPQRHHHQQLMLPALKRSTKVSRGDIVEALLRLRGDPVESTVCSGTRGRGQLLPAGGVNARRRRVLRRAVRKVARCCQAAGVRTLPMLAATLSFFDLSPVDNREREAGHMHIVDLWHWLRLLSAPTAAGDGDGRGRRASSRNNGKNCSDQRQRTVAKNRHRVSEGRRYGFGGGHGGVTSGRLLDSEETSLILVAVECRSAAEEAGRDASSEVAAAREAEGGSTFVSIPAFWNLLVEHVPGLWDRDLQAKLEAEQAERREEALRHRQSAAALTIQGTARQRQARKAVRQARIIKEERSTAALVVQRAVRKRQLYQRQARLDLIRLNEGATRIQAVQRGRVTRHHAAAERSARAAAAEKAEAEARESERRNADRTAVKIQCAARQRQARKKTADRLLRRQQERKIQAAVSIQSAVRGWLMRTAAASTRAAEEAAARKGKAAVRIQSVARGWLVRTAAAKKRAAEEAAARKGKAAVRIQSVARGWLMRTAAAKKRAAEEAAARKGKAAVRIQSVARGWLVRTAAAKKRAAREAAARKGKAAVRIQSVARGWLMRTAAAKQQAIEAAALEAAFASKQTRVAAEVQARRGGVEQGKKEWRRKSVVGARGAEGKAGLKVSGPTIGTKGGHVTEGLVGRGLP